jgi:hypothetical protein
MQPGDVRLVGSGVASAGGPETDYSWRFDADVPAP